MVSIKKYAVQTTQTDTGKPFSTWTNLENIAGEDYNYASCNVKGGEQASGLSFSGFDFNIPFDSKISSIVVTYELHKSNKGLSVRLPAVYVKKDGIKGSSMGSGSVPVKHSFHTVTFDKNSGLLNNLTPEMLNSRDFSVELTFPYYGGTSNGTLYIDNINVIVNYTSSLGYVISSGETLGNFPTVDNPKIVSIDNTFNYIVYFRSVDGSSNGDETVRVNLPKGLKVISANGSNVSFEDYDDFDGNLLGTETVIWKPSIVDGNVLSLNLTIKAILLGTNYIKSNSNVTGYTKPFYVEVTSPYSHGSDVEAISISLPLIERGKLNQFISVLVESDKYGNALISEPLGDGQFASEPDRRISLEYTNGENAPYNLLTNPPIIKDGCFNIDLNEPIKVLDDHTFNIHVVDENKNYKLNIDIPVRPLNTALNTYTFTVKNIPSTQIEQREYILMPDSGIPYFFKGVNYTSSHTSGPQFARRTDKRDDKGNLIVYEPYIVGAECNNNYVMNNFNLGMRLEKQYGYIGPVKLRRSHSQASNSTTNSEIKEQYQNRVNYGKKGDYTEVRSGTLRLPPKDVVTLQGLVQMDSPVPLDTCPSLPKGDPLALRGWAEFVALKNIKKINEFLYECSPTFDFLTYDVNTRFLIHRLNQVEGYNFKHHYEITQEAVEPLENYMIQSGNGTVYHDLKYDPEYSTETTSNYSILHKNESVRYTSKTPVSAISHITFDWLNWLYNDSNKEHSSWKMALRLINASTGEVNLQYLYHNFQHVTEVYDSTGDGVADENIINKCDVQILSRKDGNFNVKSYNDFYLNWDYTKGAIESTSKLHTVLKNLTTTKNNDTVTVDENGLITFHDSEDPVYLIAGLYTDATGKDDPIKFKEVNFKLTRLTDSKSKDYPTKTDLNGEARVSMELSQGYYNCMVTYKGDTTFAECTESLTFDFRVDLSNTRKQTHLNGISLWDSTTTPGITGAVTKDSITITDTGHYIAAQLLDANEDPVPKRKVQFRLKSIYDESKYVDYFDVTDDNGWASLQINMSAVSMLVDISFNGDMVYQPAPTIEKTVIVNLDSNKELCFLKGEDTIFKSKGLKYYVTLTDINGNVIQSRDVTLRVFIDQKGKYVDYNDKTDENGQAQLEINLNDGIYHISSFFTGDAKYNPTFTSNDINVDTNNKISVSIEPAWDPIEHHTVKKVGEIFSGILYEYRDGVNRTPLSGANITLTFGLADESATVSYNISTSNTGKFEQAINFANNGEYYCLISYDGSLTGHESANEKIYFKIAHTADELIKTNLRVVNTENPIMRTDSTVTTPLTVELTDEDGKVIEGANIDFKFTETESDYTTPIPLRTMDYFGFITSSTGLATYNIELKGDMYVSIIASYKGDDTYSPKDCSVKLRVNTGDGKEKQPKLETYYETYDANNIRTQSNLSNAIVAQGQFIGAVLSYEGKPLPDRDIKFHFEKTGPNGYSWNSGIQHSTDENGHTDEANHLYTGTYNFYAYYDGSKDKDYLDAVSTTKTFYVTEEPSDATINKGQTKISLSKSGTVTINSATKYYALVTNDAGVPIKGVTVTFTLTETDSTYTNRLRSNTYKSQTGEDGKAYVNIDLAGEWYFITEAQCPRKNEFDPIYATPFNTHLTNSTKITTVITPYYSVIGSDGVAVEKPLSGSTIEWGEGISIRLTDSDSHYIGNKTVFFKYTNVSTGQSWISNEKGGGFTVDKNGYYREEIHLAGGPYKFTPIFRGDDSYESFNNEEATATPVPFTAKVTAKPTTIKVINNTPMTITDSSQTVEVQVLDNTNTPLTSTPVSITLSECDSTYTNMISGRSKTYNLTTDSNTGIASLPITLTGDMYVKCTVTHAMTSASNGLVYDYSTTSFNMRITNTTTPTVVKKDTYITFTCNNPLYISNTNGETLTGVLRDTSGNNLTGVVISLKYQTVASDYSTVIGSTVNYDNRSVTNGNFSQQITFTGNIYVKCTATFVGNTQYNGCTATTKIRVNTTPVTPTKTDTVINVLSSNPMTITDATQSVKLQLKDVNGNALSGKNLNLSFSEVNSSYSSVIGGTKEYNDSTDSSGIVTRKIEFTGDLYAKCTVTYAGDSTYNPQTVTINIRVKTVFDTYIEITDYYGNVYNNNKMTIDLSSPDAMRSIYGHLYYTNPLTNQWEKLGKQLTLHYTFSINGQSKTYDNITSTNGDSSQLINLDANTYSLVVSFDGSGVYKGTSSRITFQTTGTRVVTNSLLGSYYDKGLSYFNDVSLGTNGRIYGSSWNMDIVNNNISILDYGLEHDGSLLSPKIAIEDLQIDGDSYYLQIENYFGKNSEISDVTLKSQYWLGITEDSTVSKYLPMYNNLIVTPQAIGGRNCKFVRKTEDSFLYYLAYNPDGDIDYLGNPRTQFEAGCDLTTSAGYSVFSTELGYNPICISNGLIKVAFHRYSHFVEIYRYSIEHSGYVLVRTVKIKEVPEVHLLKYSDDKITLTFGNTKWTIWRGHPFVQVEHTKSDLRFIRNTDTIWCEVQENTHLGTPKELSTLQSSFTPYLKLNYFTNNLNTTYTEFTLGGECVQNEGLNINTILSEANEVKTFMEKNKRLPNYVTINDVQYSTATFIYLLTVVIGKINSKDYTAPTTMSVNIPTGNYEITTTTGTLTWTNIVNMASRIKEFIITKKRLPIWDNPKDCGKVRFDKYCYIFSSILTYIGTNKYLPTKAALNTTSINSSTCTLTGQGETVSIPTIQAEKGTYPEVTDNGDRKIFTFNFDEKETEVNITFPNTTLSNLPSRNFSLYIGKVKPSTNMGIKLTCNCYDASGKVAGKEPLKIVYNLNSDDLTGNKINKIFNLVNTEYDNIKTVNFTLTFTKTAGTKASVTLGDFMLYDGYNAKPEFTLVYPGKYYDRTKVYFENNYYCKLYDKSSKFGLCVIKPEKDFIKLGYIPASNRTVFAPYIKASQKYDQPEMVAIEYMTFYEQQTIINRIE